MEQHITQYRNVVISGSLTDWGDVLIPRFTLALRIEMDQSLRLERIRHRERRNFGSRIEPGGDMYDTHQAFLAWAKSYDTGGPEIPSKVKHDQWQKLLTCPVQLLDGADTTEANYQRVLQFMNQKGMYKP